MPQWFARHWIDLIVVLTLAWYARDGLRRGFLALALETAGFALALLLATLGFRPIGGWLAARFTLPPSVANAIAFFGAWLLADLAWPFASAALETRLPARLRAAKIQKAFGLLPGLLNGILVLSVILTVASAFPIPAALRKEIVSAPLVQPLLAFTRRLDGVFAPVLHPLAEDGVNLITVHPSGGERIDLHFTYHNGTIDAKAEEKMLALVNAERTKRGLRPLVADPGLTAAARAHARDMFERGYFSHVTPEGLTPSGRLDRAGIPYDVMGENLALAPDTAIAHAGLMNSPGHRANILDADFRRVGIGVIDGGVYGQMFAQEFTD